MLEQKISVTADKYMVPPTVHMVQGDTGRVLAVEYKDYEMTGNESATMVCERPNGTNYLYYGEIDENGLVTFEMDEPNGALTREGVVKSQIILTLSGVVVTCFDINIIVHKSRGGVITEDDVTYVNQMIEKIDESIAATRAAEAATENAADAAAAANSAAEDAREAELDAEAAAATANAAAEAVAVVTGPFFIVNEANSKTYNCNIVIQSTGKPVLAYEEMVTTE